MKKTTYETYQEEMEALLGEEDVSPTLKFSVAELSKKKRAELITLCKEHSVRHYGNKEALIKALLTVKGDVEVIEATSVMTVVSIDTKGEVISAKGERV